MSAACSRRIPDSLGSPTRAKQSHRTCSAMLYNPCNLAAQPACRARMQEFKVQNSNFGEDHTMRCKSALKSAAIGIVASTALATTLWAQEGDRKSTRLNSSHLGISYAVF